jgi:hypothetical protein
MIIRQNHFLIILPNHYSAFKRFQLRQHQIEGRSLFLKIILPLNCLPFAAGKMLDRAGHCTRQTAAQESRENGLL